MHSIPVVSYINATPDKVWSVIGDPASISAWHPAVASSEVNDSKRLCQLSDGAELHEEIESVDEAA